MPDYEIKRWSTENFDIEKVQLVKQAFESRKYAFAADYIRCYALYREGGIYIDSDVMVFKDLTPLLDNARYVTGMEYHPVAKKLYKKQVDANGVRRDGIKEVNGIGLQAAIMASEPGHPFMKKCLEFYSKCSLDYIIANHLLAPIVQAKAAEEYGYKYVGNKQYLAEGIIVYPTKILGQSVKEQKGRYAAHLCKGTWVKKTFKRKLIIILDRIGLYKRYIWLKDILGII